jgi:hypothetical protein
MSMEAPSILGAEVGDQKDAWRKANKSQRKGLLEALGCKFKWE